MMQTAHVLNSEDWVEIESALKARIKLIERGEYGEGAKPGLNAVWIAEIEAIIEKIAAANADTKGTE